MRRGRCRRQIAPGPGWPRSLWRRVAAGTCRSRRASCPGRSPMRHRSAGGRSRSGICWQRRLPGGSCCSSRVNLLVVGGRRDDHEHQARESRIGEAVANPRGPIHIAVPVHQVLGCRRGPAAARLPGRSRSVAASGGRALRHRRWVHSARCGHRSGWIRNSPDRPGHGHIISAIWFSVLTFLRAKYCGPREGAFGSFVAKFRGRLKLLSR